MLNVFAQLLLFIAVVQEGKNMFEHIYFLSDRVDVESQELLQLKRYNEIVKDYGLAEEADFHIEGRPRYILPHPLTPKKQENLMFMQGFGYMDSGTSYYTKRKNYHSYLLLYTYEGTGELIYRNQKYILHEGDGFLIDCTEEHFYRTADMHWRHSDLHFYGGISTFFYEENFASKKPVFHCIQQDSYQNQLEKVLRVQSGTAVNRDFLFSFELEKLLFFVLDCLNIGAKDDEIPDNVRLLQNYLEQQFIRDISLEDMVDFAGLSKYHLCRQFKRYTGFSPKQYIIYLRLLHAQMLLRSTSIPCYKIGIMSGFQNEANFIQHFKRESGMTPGEYREKG